ncbi:MAG TPA: hypothetical protein VE152_08245 [Acidimicrobiales bacterium]|nr:hypothetical protein [Acidimicrobiales bacterium]
MWFRRSTAEETLGQALSREVEAVFAGRAASHARATRPRVPAWARLNTVAHADLADLEQLAIGRRRQYLRREERRWRGMERLLALEVLAAAHHDPSELAALQAEVLVPLELRAVHDPELSPRQVLALVLGRLEHRRRARPCPP